MGESGAAVVFSSATGFGGAGGLACIYSFFSIIFMNSNFPDLFPPVIINPDLDY